MAANFLKMTIIVAIFPLNLKLFASLHYSSSLVREKTGRKIFGHRFLFHFHFTKLLSWVNLASLIDTFARNALSMFPECNLLLLFFVSLRWRITQSGFRLVIIMGPWVHFDTLDEALGILWVVPLLQRDIFKIFSSLLVSSCIRRIVTLRGSCVLSGNVQFFSILKLLVLNLGF